MEARMEWNSHIATVGDTKELTLHYVQASISCERRIAREVSPGQLTTAAQSAEYFNFSELYQIFGFRHQ